MGGEDATGLAPYLTKQANGYLSVNLEGPGLYSTNTAGSNQFMGTTPASWKFTSSFSLRWRGNSLGSVSAPANNPAMVGVSYALTATAPYWGIVLYRSSSGATDVALNYNNGTLQSPAAVVVLNNTSTIYDIVVTLTMGGSYFIYSNGVQAGTGSALAGTPSWTATSQIVIGDGPWDVSESKTVTNLAAFWNRQLSATEVLQMYLSPYGFLSPASPEIAFPSPPPPVFILMPQIVT
jgi:hypothetical protein